MMVDVLHRTRSNRRTRQEMAAVGSEGHNYELRLIDDNVRLTVDAR